jgi:glycosyltransferase involved in cell wall biosynthesis
MTTKTRDKMLRLTARIFDSWCSKPLTLRYPVLNVLNLAAEFDQMTNSDRVLILTPAKNGAHHLDNYLNGVLSLTYPRHLISISFLESDSTDDTWSLISHQLGALKNRFRRAEVYKKDFGFYLPSGQPRYAAHFQVERRSILAKSRNHLLFRALDVLWLDIDVIEYPPDILQRLLATGKDIVQPNCVYEYGGLSFDLNAWRDHGTLHLHDLRSEGDLVPLHSVGGTMLLVRADVHRDGLIFPSFPYGLANSRVRPNNYWLGEIETEGLGIMAMDQGVDCWGMPNLEIKHHPS